LDDLDGRSYSPPINARRVSLGSDYAGWAQRIVVDSVDPDMLTAVVPKGSTPTNRITVTITHNGRTVCTLSWIACDASQ
jgi:hypothetical protein